MKKYFPLCFIGLGVSLISTAAFGVDVDDIAGGLETPVVILTKVLLFACYVVGAILILGALAQYRNHRQSPKLVPLTTPILLLVLGVVLLLVPYFSTLGDSTSAVEQQKKQGKGPNKGSYLGGETIEKEEQLGPGYLPEDEPEEPYYPEDNSGGSTGGGSSGGGHWGSGY